ncbi:MAG TPA: hypothetical protein IGS37_03375 [Synechococcales cyanobacterium M55_K2018_004]|nr:hypothetical protein [Synechococcales cyanobacterium M55_K2018_004]
MSNVKSPLNVGKRGWAINIYDGDRRLLCTLDPSHGWAFATGIVLGGLLVLGWTVSDRPPSTSPFVPPQTAPLSVD